MTTDSALRILGVALAIALPFIGFWLDESVLDLGGVESAIIGFVFVGFVVGALWRSWWSLAVVVIFGVAYSVYLLVSPEGVSWDGSPVVLTAILGISPALLGASVGTAASKRLGRRTA